MLGEGDEQQLTDLDSDDDRVIVTDIEEGKVEDDRIDTGRYEQGLWAAAACGPSVEVAAKIASAEHENDHQEV